MRIWKGIVLGGGSVLFRCKCYLQRNCQGWGSVLVALQMVFATALFWVVGAFLWRCKWYLQRYYFGLRERFEALQMVFATELSGIGVAYFSVANFICYGSFLDWVWGGDAPTEQD